LQAWQKQQWHWKSDNSLVPPECNLANYGTVTGYTVHLGNNDLSRLKHGTRGVTQIPHSISALDLEPVEVTGDGYDPI
jgi:hypothetical protein